MSDLRERVATLEEGSRRQEVEIKGLRDSRHAQAGMIQSHKGILSSHEGILSNMSESIKKLSISIDKWVAETADNTATLRDFKIMGKTGLYLVGGLGGIITVLLGFIGSKLLGWW